MRLVNIEGSLLRPAKGINIRGVYIYTLCTQAGTQVVNPARCPFRGRGEVGNVGAWHR
jgi:hypothetical protein